MQISHFPAAKLFIALVLALFARSRLEAESTSFALSQPFGSYGVGFRVVEQYDHARSFARRTGPLGVAETGSSTGRSRHSSGTHP